MNAAAIPRLTAAMVWQGGGASNPEQTQFAIDAWCVECFGLWTPRCLLAYECVREAIVEMDPLMPHRLPETVNAECWNDDLRTSPELVESVWDRAMELFSQLEDSTCTRVSA